MITLAACEALDATDPTAALREQFEPFRHDLDAPGGDPCDVAPRFGQAGHEPAFHEVAPRDHHDRGR